MPYDDINPATVQIRVTTTYEDDDAQYFKPAGGCMSVILLLASPFVCLFPFLLLL